MAKGSIAKGNLIKRFADAVGADYVGEYDKKWYFWSTENGERVQVAVSLTCPKTPVGESNVNTFGGEEVAPAAAPATMSESEQAQLDKLMVELGL